MKKIVLIIFTFFIGITSIFAVNTIPRTENDLGVNKKWKINEENIDNVLNTPRVDATEKIYDFANILGDTTEIFNEIQKYINDYQMDLVIITTDLEMDDYELEDYAADFYDYNDFGIQFEHYSGTILIINMNDFNRFYNIYTFGEGQLYYSYNSCERILDDIFYEIKAGNYSNALLVYISELSTIYEEYENNGSYIDDNGRIVKPKAPFYTPWAFSIFGALISTTISLIVMIKKNKLVAKASDASEYLNKESIKYNKKNDIFLHSHTSSYVVSSSSNSSHSGSSGGYSHSGSSGGSHGGGGGRHF